MRIVIPNFYLGCILRDLNLNEHLSQIWQQLELWNVPIFQNLSADVQQLLTADIQMLQENGENISVTGSSNHSQNADEDLEQMNSSNSENAHSDSDCE